MVTVIIINNNEYVYRDAPCDQYFVSITMIYVCYLCASHVLRLWYMCVLLHRWYYYYSPHLFVELLLSWATSSSWLLTSSCSFSASSLLPKAHSHLQFTGHNPHSLLTPAHSSLATSLPSPPHSLLLPTTHQPCITLPREGAQLAGARTRENAWVSQWKSMVLCVPGVYVDVGRDLSFYHYRYINNNNTYNHEVSQGIYKKAFRILLKT